MSLSNDLIGMDYDGALNRLDGDVELLREIAKLAIVECPQILDELQAALLSENVDVVQRESHKMKGSVASIGAIDAYHWADELERNAQAGDLFEASLSLHNLVNALKIVRPAWLELAEQVEGYA